MSMFYAIMVSSIGRAHRQTGSPRPRSAALSPLRLRHSLILSLSLSVRRNDTSNQRIDRYST